MAEEIFHKNYRQVFDACKNALSDCGFEIKSDSPDSGIIKASKGTSVFQWGKELEIWVSKVDESNTKVIAESVSLAQIIRLGANNKSEKLLWKD